MGEFNYDQERDYSDLNDQNREELRAQQKQGSARGFYGDFYNPSALESAENSSLQQTKSTDQQITESERSGGVNHISKVGSKPKSSKTAAGLKKRFTGSKKALLTAGVSLTIFGGIAAYTPFLIGAIMPIHVAEIINEKLNWAARDLQFRSNGIFSFQTKKGYKCKNAASCSFQNVSEKQIKKFRENGWTIDDADLEDVGFGKKKLLKATSPDGDILDSDTLPKFLSNPKNRVDLKRIYSGKFYSFRDKIFTRVAQTFNLHKAKKTATSDSESEIIQDSIDQANGKQKSRLKHASEDPEEIAEYENGRRPDGEKITTEDFDNQAASKSNKFFDDLKEIGTSAKGSFSSITGKINDLISKTSILNAGCTILQVVKGVSIGAKTMKATIIAGFAFHWLSMFNKLKAGDATAAEVSAMGNLLTGFVTPDSGGEDKAIEEGVDRSRNSNSEENQSKTNIYKASFANFLKSFSSTQEQPAQRKSATDSQGWQSIAYGSLIKNLDTSATKWVAGVFFASTVLDWVTTNLYQGPIRTACRIVTSPFMDKLDFVGDVLAFLATGGIAAGVGLAITNFGLPMLLGPVLETLSRILAGDVVNKTTRGEDFGNALVSGASSTMGKNSIAGGGALLDKDEAVEAYMRNQELIALEAEEIRSELSPLDPSSRHTFVGSILSNAIPYQHQIATVGGFIPSMIAMTRNSFASILPTASANNAANFRTNMDNCNDETFKVNNIATDIFCNPYSAVPNSSIRVPIDEVIEKLTAEGEYNPEKEGVDNDTLVGIKEGSKMDLYHQVCVKRDVPIGVPFERKRTNLKDEAFNFLGLTADDDEVGEAKACITSKDNPLVPYYSAFFTDIRIKTGMDDDSFIDQANQEKQSVIDGIAYPTSEKYRQLSTNFGADGYSQGVFHNGIDVPLPEGNPIYAFKDGTVFSTRDANSSGPDSSDNGGCGGMVYIDHGLHDNKPLISQYCHLQKGSLTVKDGDNVKAGQEIAKSGNTGLSTGPHLHFGLRKTKSPSLRNNTSNAKKEDINKDYYDPTEILKEYKKV